MKYKVGDIVSINDDEYPDFKGNLAIIENVSNGSGGWENSYSIGEIHPIPFSAWHDESKLKLVKSIDTIVKELNYTNPYKSPLYKALNEGE